MKRQQPRLRFQHSTSTAKYSPMERVVAVVGTDEADDGAITGDDYNLGVTPGAASGRSSRINLDTDAVKEGSSQTTVVSTHDHTRSQVSPTDKPQRKSGAPAWKSPSPIRKARIASEEKLSDISETDLVSIGCVAVTLGDSSSTTQATKSSDDSAEDSAFVKIPFDNSLASLSVPDPMEQLQDKTFEKSARDSSQVASVGQSEGNYRLSIYVGDDSSPIASSPNDMSMVTRPKWTPEADSTRRDSTSGVQTTVVHISNYDTQPTIKISTTDGHPPQAQNLTLPLGNIANNKYLSEERVADGLSPMVRSPSTSSSLGRQNGSSTPRLRISTPKTSPAATPGGASVQGANGIAKAQEPEKKPEIRSGPSSRRTVVVIAGLFVVGLILILSGIIVLSVEEHTEFRITGSIFLGCGIVFFIICLILQKKNVKKLVNELEKDLFFLNVTDNKVWNFIFHFDEQVAWS